MKEKVKRVVTLETMKKSSCLVNGSSHCNAYSLDQICAVIDIEGWNLRKGNGFIHRELGYCDHTGKIYGTIHYMPKTNYTDLDEKDRKTVHWITREIHGLSYYPSNHSHAEENITTDIRNLYARFRTPERHCIGYKGGRIEFNLLRFLSIPSLNLETFGCPKFIDLPRTTKVGTCGQHLFSHIHHCPQIEYYSFVNWMKQQEGDPSYDSCYVNTERLKKFL